MGQYTALKRAVYNAFPFFDGNALDAARFIFGADCGDVVWHEGWMGIDEEVPVETADEEVEGYVLYRAVESKLYVERIVEKPGCFLTGYTV